MRFTIPALIIVQVTDLNALVEAAIWSAASRDCDPDEPRLDLSTPMRDLAAEALTELAYPPALIDGQPGVHVSGYVLGTVLAHNTP